MDLMIDLETLSTTPDALILTIGAQAFEPTGNGVLPHSFYARINTDTQLGRSIDESTVEWWSTQPAAAQDEAFGPENRIELSTALDELGRLIWRSKNIWANGIVFDMGILEDAYRSHNLALPWTYGKVRDARTVYSLWKDLPKPAVTHHALEDCVRQIGMLQQTLTHLNITEL